jgi:hypothetical protein
MALNTVTLDQARTKRYDAVVVPGGGIDPCTGAPRPWVAARLDAAIQLDEVTRYFMVLSRGTTHRSPPINTRGHPVDESTASAAYLLKNGPIDPSRVLVDTWSLDTIGNAFFARMMLAEPLGLHSLIVITSAFHMLRTREIFEWVFSLPSVPTSLLNTRSTSLFQIDYCITDDVGLAPEDLASRVDKEQAGLEILLSKTMPCVTTLSSLASFVATEHGAYNAKNAVEDARTPDFTSAVILEDPCKHDGIEALNTY